MVALIDFVDLTDGNHLYHAGDNFPRDGADVGGARIAELSGDQNALGLPVIGDAEEPEETKEVEDKPKRGRKKNAD